MRFSLTVAIVMFAISAPAYAQFPTMAELSKRCEAVRFVGEKSMPEVALERSADLAFCEGYLVAVFQQSVNGSAINGVLFCTTAVDAIKADQLAKIFIKYANDHPAKLHENAFKHALLSFMEAFPCTTKR